MDEGRGGKAVEDGLGGAFLSKMRPFARLLALGWGGTGGTNEIT